MTVIDTHGVVYKLPGPWERGDRLRAVETTTTLLIERHWKDGDTTIIDVLYDGPYKEKP